MKTEQRREEKAKQGNREVFLDESLKRNESLIVEQHRKVKGKYN